MIFISCFSSSQVIDASDKYIKNRLYRSSPFFSYVEGGVSQILGQILSPISEALATMPLESHLFAFGEILV